jgi:hypothetical protein
MHEKEDLSSEMSSSGEGKLSWRISSKRLKSRTARFVLVQHTKTGKIYQITTKYVYQISVDLPNGRKIYQMAVKYTKWPYNMPNVHKIYQMAVKYTRCP